MLMRAHLIAAPSSPIADKKVTLLSVPVCYGGRALAQALKRDTPQRCQGRDCALSFQSSGHGSSRGAELWTGFYLSSSFSPSGRCGTTEEKRASDAGATLRAQRDGGQLHCLLTGAAQPCSASLHPASFH